jgi:hypothetical protein
METDDIGLMTKSGFGLLPENFFGRAESKVFAGPKALSSHFAPPKWSQPALNTQNFLAGLTFFNPQEPCEEVQDEPAPYTGRHPVLPCKISLQSTGYL